MNADLIVYNIGQLVTGRELSLKDGESSMENIEILENGYIAISGNEIMAFGAGEVPSKLVKFTTKLLDAEGCVVTPGLIDSHTHLVHGGSRENEFLDKIQGVPYLDILERGGGILSTVKATREATEDELLDKAKKTLRTMLSLGVTTVESKSGYGLDSEIELKQLKVNERLNHEQEIEIVSTFMGAHAVPKEYENNREEFIKKMLDLLPIIKERKLAEFFDVFCEKGVFTTEESKKMFKEAKKYGLKLRIHADEIENTKGAELAKELHMYSADHLMAISDEGIKALKNSKVIANLLPGTSFSLGKEYAPARKMIDNGVQVALSTDYNPGSCPTENLQLIMQIAALKLKMRPKEILKAVTLNAARSIGREKKIGSIEEGKKADFVIFDAKNIEYILYRFGVNHTKQVFKNGCLVYKK
ncbi:imidazolonepropionase [Candidatus Cetobacterium colombiensis]|uniref:Imidazolonepropionase n=1 Tax=Candidatus Cetobacterium colombiensis TaxID=3073100 RepID=A0ABU4W9E0_9FUSO|nr:imidazolonepropionase [Candidatus Cetobacterium colombiensis]MDX8335035.1 imidazolonepropionase [Candidatus Cetobacterium colombiensis]